MRSGAGWVVMALALALVLVVVVVEAEGDMILDARPKSERSIVFPGDRRFPEPAAQSPAAPALELPHNLDLDAMDIDSLSLVNNIDNITSFARLFGINLPPDVITRVGGIVPERAVMATCKPELSTVKLDLPVEPNTLFYPTCVRLEQCGGCCYGPLLTCRPKRTEALKLEVLKTKISDSSSGGRTGRRERRRRRRRDTENSYEVVEVLKHLECECGCIVRETDCNKAVHTYQEGECACVCNNKNAKAECEAQSHTKYWDDDTCSCYCRRPVPCSSGQFFSPVSCRCE